MAQNNPRSSGGPGRPLFLLTVTLLFLWVLSPFLISLAMGLVFGVMFSPLQVRLLKRSKLSPWLAGLIVTGGVTLIVILPLALLLFLAAQNGLELMQSVVAENSSMLSPAKSSSGDWLSPFFHQPWVESILDWARTWIPFKTESLVGPAKQAIKSIGIWGSELLGQALTQIPSTVLGLGVIILTLYFELVDGPKLKEWVKKISVFSEASTERLLKVMGNMSRSVVLASLVSGLAQSLVFFVFVVACGLPNPFLAGVLIFVFSFVPVVGSMPVSLGYMIYAFIEVSTGTGIAMVFGAILVSTLDNFVRPVFLKGAGGLHPLLALLAALGGLRAMGIAGIFLGPLIVELFFISWEIWIKERSGERETVLL